MDDIDHIFWSTFDTVSSKVSDWEYEANLYYAGVRSRGYGPKLVHRISRDRFKEPTGPEAYKRLMRIVAVPDSHNFGQKGLWDNVRDKVRASSSFL